MPEFNPNEMDALFREGAERHQFEYNHEAWALMEEKLDKKSKRRSVLFFLIGLVLLVLSILVCTYYNVKKNAEKESVASVLQSDMKEKTQTEAISIEKELIGSFKEKTSIVIAPQKTKNEYISTDSKESSSNIGAQYSFQSENTGNLVRNEVVSMPSLSENTAGINLYPEEDAPGDKNIQKIDIDKHVLLKSLSRTKISSLPVIDNHVLELFDRAPFDLNTIKLNPSKTKIESIEPTNTTNRFAATIFANPEWSSVGLFKESKAGWSLGGRFGYQFADKFEVSAGLAFSRKIYKGTGVEYSMEGGWFNDIEPMQMDAKCDVIEIPVGVSYYRNGFRNSGLFVDLGVNSYMLHSEWYGFDYNDALVRPERYTEVIKEDQNSHLVGVGRFAIGYQKVISNYASFQIAPYLQFPLTGIGAGQVNLYSSGIQVALKFNTQ